MAHVRSPCRPAGRSNDVVVDLLLDLPDEALQAPAAQLAYLDGRHAGRRSGVLPALDGDRTNRQRTGLEED
eukprot:12090791-Alexandrium_andersonii.AAC.1